MIVGGGNYLLHNLNSNKRPHPVMAKLVQQLMYTKWIIVSTLWPSSTVDVFVSGTECYSKVMNCPVS